MAAKTVFLRRLFNKAEEKFGFRFACEMHNALASGSPVAQSLVRRVLA